MSSIYENWMHAKAQLDYYKEIEKTLRTEICDSLLKKEPTGTHNFTIDGFYIKATKRMTTSLDEDMLGFIWDDLSEEEQSCIKFKPSIIAKEYKNCTDHNDLDQAIIMKPAMPTLSIEMADK